MQDRGWKVQRLADVNCWIKKMERELELHEAMGAPEFLNNPLMYETHVKRLKRFEAERDSLERQLRPTMLDRTVYALVAVVLAILGLWAALTAPGK